MSAGSLTSRKDENGWKDGAKGVEQGAGQVLGACREV